MALTNSEIKFIQGLQRKKNRLENNLFVVEGEKLISELLKQTAYSIHRLLGTEKLDHEKFTMISPKELERISNLKTPNKFLAIVAFSNFQNDEFPNKILMIDKINDPGNLGTIIRTADWFGIKQIILQNESVDHYNSKVVQSTMGAIFRVNIKYINLENEITHLKQKGFTVYGACMKGDSIHETDFKEKSILLMGSESHGISETLLKQLDHKITIPKTGHTESLNLGVATGIILSQLSS